MRRLERLNWRAAVCWCVLAIAAPIAVECAYGLRMTEMPKNIQTMVAEPRDSAMLLKLPLRQPVFHWTFLSRQDFLAGKLALHITRADQTSTITIFENGKFSEGWESIVINNPGAGEIYFGFQSSTKYPTAPGARLKIELHVKKNLDGIGSMQTGVLPAGTYTAEGIYSGLIDEYAIPDLAKDLPEETISKLRKRYEFKAFMENWQIQWPLQITGDKGWLSPAQRHQAEKTLKALREADTKE